jgi:hypothetical protein
MTDRAIAIDGARSTALTRAAKAALRWAKRVYPQDAASARAAVRVGETDAALTPIAAEAEERVIGKRATLPVAALALGVAGYFMRARAKAF